MVIVQITFDSAGNVIAEQIKPGEERRAPAATAAKKSKKLFKTLDKPVTAGNNELKLKLTKTGKKMLKKKSKLKAKMRFTFTPTGGDRRASSRPSRSRRSPRLRPRRASRALALPEPALSRARTAGKPFPTVSVQFAANSDSSSQQWPRKP